VPATVVNGILQQNIARGPLNPLQTNLIPHVLGLLTDERPLAGSQAPRRNTIFEMGSLHLKDTLLERESPVSLASQLVLFEVLADGLQRLANNQASHSPFQHLSLESALFPFLLPFGLGAYDGAITLCKYLRMRMRCFFSIFTLHKLYLLMMYQICQAVVLSNNFKQSQLEREIF
jgi:hypothetical protein